MRTINLKNNKPFASLQLSKRLSKYIAVLLSIAILNLSCSYYNVKKVPTSKENIAKNVKAFNDLEKYVIIHSKGNPISWHLSNMVINEDTQTISGTILPISEQHKSIAPRKSKKTHRYNKDKSKPFNEVHFTLIEPANFQYNTTVDISLSNIESITTNDPNTGRATTSIVMGTLGGLFVAFLLVLALKSSCPFVYIKNGDEFDFVGELYPGTITPNMQKDDYLQLPEFNSENGDYVLKVSNHLKEIQYTDQLQLVLVNHDNNVKVLLDSKGELQTFSKINTPVSVLDDIGNNVLTTTLKKDDNVYSFNSLSVVSNSTRNIVFEFDKPENIKEAKLLLTAKNSVWLDYIFGQFNAQFGSYYNTFQKDQQKVDSKIVTDWTNKQNIPLSVYLKTDKGWQLIERINTVGPLAMRDIVVPLKLDETYGKHLQIKLQTGFMFWEVDYVGIDFSENIDLEVAHVSPSKAIDQNGKDVTDLLLSADENYLVQPNIGDEVLVVFPEKNFNPKQKQSVFLKNRGYYNYIRDYKGIPDLEQLKSFKEDHSFTKFSEDAYFKFINIDSNNLAYE